FKGSPRTDFFYWVFYVVLNGQFLIMFTPIGIVEKLIAPYFNPIVDLTTLLGASWTGVLVTTIIGLLALDFTEYWVHRLLHKVPFFWKFHAVHHAADEMSILTGVRLTLTERAINDFFSILFLKVLGLTIAPIIFVLAGKRFLDLLQHSNVG